MERITPAMQQFFETKKQYPDCIIFFRMGDFYEMFYEDAETAARVLNITLTKRGGAPLAGLPYHSLEPHLAKMVKAGYKVAICEQVENPKLAKGRVVKREVVQVITPGTITIPTLLDHSANNYVMAIIKTKQGFGVALSDISTGSFYVTSLGALEKVKHEINRFDPAEIILPEDSDIKLERYTSAFDDRYFSYHYAYQGLTRHFNVNSLEGYGIEQDEPAIMAAGGLLQYLQETQKGNMQQIKKMQQFKQDNYMVLDRSTIQNLELFKNIRDQTERGTVYATLNETVTPMGARLLRTWLQRPLLIQKQIEERLEAIETLTQSSYHREALRNALSDCYDIERLITKIANKSANPKDVIALLQTLKQIPLLKEHLSSFSSTLINIMKDMPTQEQHKLLITKALTDNPKTKINEGGIIRKGYNAELDELREIASGGKTWITALEEKEKQRSGIPTLRIGFNRVHGYYIEVTRRFGDKVPDHYIRKQTIKNAERFITEELKQKEEKILNAEEKMHELEQELFFSLLSTTSKDITVYQTIGSQIATLDVLINFASIAKKRNYTKPVFNNENVLNIQASRHPVVEDIQLDPFIANDIHMDAGNSMMVITGPNMAGKSTFMRQIAIIQLMAQIGCFIPAMKSDLPIMERIFTRVGAYDDLTSGQSTFMVEMNETANILNNATEKSLIILDEIGRGTSTYDGIAIAHAVAEFIYKNIKAKTLFATHYHQLNKLSNQYPGIKNFNIAVKEKDESIVFLRKIVEGGTDKSYGVHVAKLAGLPQDVIDRSMKIMNMLETDDKIAERIHSQLKEEKNVKEEIKEKTEKKVEKEIKEESKETAQGSLHSFL